MGLKHWRRRGPSEAEMREELESHLAMRGELEGDASARRKFGSALRTQEEVRAVWHSPLWDTILQDARHTWRGWRRNPAFSLSAIGTLALGLGAATALFSVCDRILFRSLPYADPDRLVSVGLLAPLDANEFLLGADYSQLWRTTPAPFDSVTTVAAGSAACDLTESQPERLACASAEANLLRVLGLRVAAGRDLTAEDDKPGAPRVALISHGLWMRRYGGSHSAIGNTLIIDRQPVRIAGVLPDGFQMPTLSGADILLPQQLPVIIPGRPGPMHFLRVFARLKNGVTPQQAALALEPLFLEMLKNVPPAFRKEVTLRVRSLRDRQLGDSARAAWFLLAAVGALLLIACTNVANLLLARTAARHRELAIRAALGAGRARLARLALTESLLLALASGAIGLLIAAIFLRLFVSLAPGGIPKLSEAALDPRAALAGLALAVGAALLIGIWPARAVPRPESLHGARTTAAARPWTRFAFVVTQIALTFALLGTSALLLRGLWKLQSTALGFEAERVYTAGITLNAGKYPTPERQIAFFERLLEQASALPGVTAAAITDSLPPSGQMRTMIYAAIEVDGRPLPAGGTGGMVPWRLVTPGYFDALRIPIVRGRGFTPTDRNAPEPAMIISESLERKLFPNGDALGKRVRPGRGTQPWHVIVGVAANVRNAGLATPTDPEYYVVRGLATRDAMRRSFVVIRTHPAASAAAGLLRQTIAAMDPELPLTVERVTDRVSQLAARPRFTAVLLACFGALALLLAAAGLAGVAGYLVTQRTRDIGVRMALGATPAAVTRQVLAEAARWVIAGSVLGAFAAAAASRIIATMTHGIAPYDPWAWAVSIVTLIAVLSAAVLRPALRASRIDPITALRTD